MKKRLRIIWPILLAEIAVLTFSSWKWGAQNLNSDLSADMILPELLSRTGGIVSNNWYYSTEFRFLHTQLILKPFFLFMSDWRLIRACGTAVCLLLLAGSFIFLCKSVSSGKNLLLAAPLILWPFSYTYQTFVLFGLCYVPYLFILFISLGLVLGRDGRRESLRRAALLILSFAAGIGGFRMPAVCYAPLVFAAAVSGISYSESRKWEAGPELFRSVIALAGSFAGWLVNALFLSSRYHFATHEEIRLTAPQWGRLIQAVKHAITVMGANNPARASFSSVPGVLMFLVLLLISVFYVRLLMNWRTLSREIRTFLVFVLLCFLATAAVPFLTTEYWSERYMIFPGVCFLLIPGLYFSHFPLSSRSFAALCALILVPELAAGIAQYRSFAVNERYPEQKGVIQYVLGSGMEFGFGGWGCSDVLTELSDGRIHLCKLIDFSAPYAWYWLMETDFRKYAEDGPVFLIIENDLLNSLRNGGENGGDPEKVNTAYIEAGTAVYEDDYFTVLQYDSLERFEEAAGRTF